MLYEEPTWFRRRVLFIRTMRGGIFILKSCQLLSEVCEMLNPIGIPSYMQREVPYIVLFFKWKDMNSVLLQCAKFSA